jgi:hypothetical protein
MTDHSVPKRPTARTKTPTGRGILSRPDLPAIVLAATLAFALLAFGIPRTIAAWEDLAAQPALEKIWVGKTPSEAQLSEGIAGLQRAVAWVPSARRLTDWAMLELQQAVGLPPGDASRTELLSRAEQHLIDGLIANPADGFAWVRLAIVRELRGASGRQIALALAQSLDMAPNDRRLWLFRARMFLNYWRYLTPDELFAMRSQLRTIWTADKATSIPLLQAAQRADALPVIVWALSDDAAAQEKFEQWRATLPMPGAR